ncbi:MAG TPA: PspC domain-containing protein [Allosphingosinicella sp.]|nr:PspC domain-containing protein [Allosphingosinicella sp.]
MPDFKSNLLTRDDTLFGICQALGEDFGFNPFYLRVAFAASLLWNPLAVVALYFGVGILVAASRLAFPSRSAAVPPATEAATEVETAHEEEPLAEAA